MNRMLVLLPVAAAAVALTLSPAMAKKKHHRHHHQGHYAQPYAYGPGPWGAPGWNTRNVYSDPSLGHPSAAELSRRSGRCVSDLGYGRYEYCGW
jgi:hypothetical protein